MSVATHEEEPIDEVEGFCQQHGEYFYHGEGCEACGEEAIDRAIQDKRDDRGRSA